MIASFEGGGGTGEGGFYAQTEEESKYRVE